MKLYIANTTQQVQDFMYRLPESNSVRSQRIEIGGQIRISGDLTTPDIDAIVQQHAKYGMIEVSTIDRTRPFIGMCYSIDKPVPVEKIRVAMIHNAEVLTEIGRENRKNAAVATSNQMEETAPGLQSLEMSIVEEQRKDGKTPEFAEGVRVTRRETQGHPPPARGAVRSRKAN